jgi:hypothetical protein
MKKDDMIKYLVEDGDFTKKELKKLKIADVQELFDERFSVEYEDENFSKGLEFGEDYVDDPTIERTLVESVTHPSDVEEETEEEVIEIDLKSLSPVERRAYARTGVIPVIRVNKYTRFDDETPKMDN